jgi:L-iditol 2-dehydrogenase
MSGIRILHRTGFLICGQTQFNGYGANSMKDLAATSIKETLHPVNGNKMRAAVYRGPHDIVLEKVPVPEIQEREILLQVHTCGICGTDLKKIEYGLVPPPRIFGHEIAGTVARVGSKVTQFKAGDRVTTHHHIPCRNCYFCEKKLFSQCDSYRRTGTTAGFEPAGGGFAEYVRVMDWIVKEGTIRIPDDVSFEEASFLEPLNTCLKALETAELVSGEVVAIYGQGSIGLMLTQAARYEGARVVGLDFLEGRLEIARELGAETALNPERDNVGAAVGKMTEGRGADLAVVAAANPDAIEDAQNIVRRGGRVLLFAQTVAGEMIPVDASRICIEEKRLIGSYSASVELQGKAAHLIFSRKINVARLVSHRLPLELLPKGIHIASNPSDHSLKVVIQP